MAREAGRLPRALGCNPYPTTLEVIYTISCGRFAKIAIEPQIKIGRRSVSHPSTARVHLLPGHLFSGRSANARRFSQHGFREKYSLFIGNWESLYCGFNANFLIFGLYSFVGSPTIFSPSPSPYPHLSCPRSTSLLWSYKAAQSRLQSLSRMPRRMRQSSTSVVARTSFGS